MFILNQISGIGDFSIADNLRLIVIAAIFIGIIAVLLYLKSAKNGRNAKSEYVQAANSHVSGGKEKRHSADAQDDFLSIEEEAEAMPVVNLDKTVTDIEEMEEGIDTKQGVDTKDVGSEFATKIEGLISKIEERERAIINKVEDVVDARVQEALSKINDRIDEVLQAQKDSAALVLEKLIGADSATHSKTVIDNKAEFEEITEGDLEVSGEDSDLSEGMDSSLRGASVGITESGGTEEVADVPEKTMEDDLEIPSEAKEGITAEREEQIASSKKIEGNRSGEMAEESDDLDILEFLKEDSIGISLPEESNADEEIAGLPEENKEEFPEEPSEVDEGEKKEVDETIALSGVIDKNVLAVDGADSADFDINEFLEELGDLPSEENLEDEKG